MTPVKLPFKFFGQNVFFESTGDKAVDEAMSQVFMDSYITKNPTEMWRPHVKKVMDWFYSTDIPKKKSGQMLLEL